jgi:hypothetical protein
MSYGAGAFTSSDRGATMAKPKQDPGIDEDGMSLFATRLTNLLALHLVKDMTKTERARWLRRAGFKAAEMASLLGTPRKRARRAKKPR